MLDEETKIGKDNRDELLKADEVGCYHCLEIFHPSEIEEWIDDDETGVCPFCDVDSLVPNPEPEQLEELYLEWFDEPV